MEKFQAVQQAVMWRTGQGSRASALTKPFCKPLVPALEVFFSWQVWPRSRGASMDCAHRWTSMITVEELGSNPYVLTLEATPAEL